MKEHRKADLNRDSSYSTVTIQLEMYCMLCRTKLVPEDDHVMCPTCGARYSGSFDLNWYDSSQPKEILDLPIICPAGLQDGGICRVYKSNPCSDCPIPDGQHKDFLVQKEES